MGSQNEGSMSSGSASSSGSGTSSSGSGRSSRSSGSSGSPPPRDDGDEKRASEDLNVDAVESKGAAGPREDDKEETGQKGDGRVGTDTVPEPMDTQQQQHSPKVQVAPAKAQEKRRSPSPTFQSARLVVSNLTRNTTEGHLKEIFGHYGVLRSVHIAMDQQAGLPKGFANLEFDHREDAERALDFMHGGQVDGNVVRVNFVIMPKRRSPPPQSTSSLAVRQQQQQRNPASSFRGNNDGHDSGRETTRGRGAAAAPAAQPAGGRSPQRPRSPVALPPPPKRLPSPHHAATPHPLPVEAETKTSGTGPGLGPRRLPHAGMQARASAAPQAGRMLHPGVGGGGGGDRDRDRRVASPPGPPARNRPQQRSTPTPQSRDTLVPDLCVFHPQQPRTASPTPQSRDTLVPDLCVFHPQQPRTQPPTPRQPGTPLPPSPREAALAPGPAQQRITPTAQAGRLARKAHRRWREQVQVPSSGTLPTLATRKRRGRRRAQGGQLIQVPAPQQRSSARVQKGELTVPLTLTCRPGPLPCPPPPWPQQLLRLILTQQQPLIFLLNILHRLRQLISAQQVDVKTAPFLCTGHLPDLHGRMVHVEPDWWLVAA
ncbi:MAG: hypothetical protein WDW38_001444 [Sanguina aurantia]